jgi:hypothetical protein
VATLRTRLAVDVRDVGPAAAVSVVASVEGLGLLRRRRRQEERAVGGHGRGAEERILGRAGQEVGGVELLDAGVEAAEAASHGLRAEELDGRGGRQSEHGEEEVDHVLASLREQHALRLAVDEELRAERRDGGGDDHRLRYSWTGLAGELGKVDPLLVLARTACFDFPLETQKERTGSGFFR